MIMAVGMVMIVAVIMPATRSVHVVMIVIMPVVMVVAVMMMMGMTAGQLILVTSRLQQLLGRHLLHGGVGLLGDIVDHLVFEDRRPELDQRGRVLLVVFIDNALLARLAARPLDQGPAQLVLIDLDAVLLA